MIEKGRKNKADLLGSDAACNHSENWRRGSLVHSTRKAKTGMEPNSGAKINITVPQAKMSTHEQNLGRRHAGYKPGIYRNVKDVCCREIPFTDHVEVLGTWFDTLSMNTVMFRTHSGTV